MHDTDTSIAVMPAFATISNAQRQLTINNNDSLQTSPAGGSIAVDTSIHRSEPEVDRSTPVTQRRRARMFCGSHDDNYYLETPGSDLTALKRDRGINRLRVRVPRAR